MPQHTSGITSRRRKVIRPSHAMCEFRAPRYENDIDTFIRMQNTGIQAIHIHISLKHFRLKKNRTLGNNKPSN